MLTRRTALAVAAAPFVRAYAAQEPRDKIKLALIGLANRGEKNWSEFTGEEVTALCDVDPKHAEKARATFPKAKFFTDMRKLFDEEKLFDGVVVSTPDHTHAYPTLRALGQNKHVYCEKPLARTVSEVRAIRTAAAKSRGVTQMGTQIHAGDNYRRVVELVRDGVLGPIRDVYVWLGSGPQKGKRVKAEPPAGLDLDLWRGPVPDEFFVAAHADKHAWPHFNWRYWYQYGGGHLGDFGCHYMDLPFWALGLTTPSTVLASGERFADADNDVPATMRVQYGFGTVNLRWEHGVSGPMMADIRRTFAGYPNGVLFAGANGYLVADYSKHRLYPKALADEVKRPDPTIAKSIGHHKEWAEAVRGKGTALCEFSYACNLAETVQLGNLAYRVAADQALRWDGKRGWFVGRPEADDLIHAPVRKGWEV